MAFGSHPTDDIPAENVIGHSEIKATACPGKLFPLAEVSRDETFDF